ncbi:MAG: hypothetical protein GY938_27135 [Ketobacter sp.]|nr:hypothetical protein [Ketobacter sp.]
MAQRYGALTLQIKQLSNMANIGSSYTTILNASGVTTLNSIGTGSFSFPRHATIYSAIETNLGQVAHVTMSDAVGGSGYITTFIMETMKSKITTKGVVTTVSGATIDAQLSYANLADDTIDDGAGGKDTTDISTIMTYAPSGWSHNGTETTSGTYHTSRGDTVFQVLVAASKQSGEHFRLSSPVTKQLNWYQSTDSSGITLRMPTDPTMYDGSTTVGIVTDMSLSTDFAPAITGVRPYGAGIEDGRLDLTGINAGDTGGDPAGYTTTFASNLIVNGTLETSLGYEKREDVDFSHIKASDPTSTTHLTTAAVSLWDEAIYYLQQRDNSRVFYDIDCIVPANIYPGQSITVVYSESEGGTSGGSSIISINAAFKIHKVNHGIGKGGVRLTKLTVSDDLVPRPDAVHFFRQVAEKTQATTRKSDSSTSPGSVPSSRTITTTFPVRIDAAGSADLSANRTLSFGTISGTGTANELIGMVSAANDVEYKNLVAGTGIGIAHGVGTITFTNTDPATGKADSTEDFVTIGNSSGLSSERALTAGDGLDMTDNGANSSVVFTVDVTDFLGDGLTESGNDIDLGTPSTLTAATSNAVTASSHTHDITTSSTATASTISAYDANGRMEFNGVGIGTSPDSDDLKVASGTWIGIGTSGARFVFTNAATDTINLASGFLGINKTTPTASLHIASNGSNPALVLQAGPEGELATSSGGFIRIGHWNGSVFTERMQMTSAGGWLIGTTDQTDLTIGLGIDQGSGTDDTVQLRASGYVAHGMTSINDTDIFCVLRPRSSTQGGVHMRGLTEGEEGIGLTASVTTAVTTDTASSLGASVFRSYIKSGTSHTNMGATANTHVFRNGSTTTMLLKGDGDMHITNTTLTALDDYDDVALLRTFDRETTVRGVIDSQWDRFIEYNRETLESAGIIKGDFISLQAMQRLTSGAVWQLHTRIAQLEARLGNA